MARIHDGGIRQDKQLSLDVFYENLAVAVFEIASSNRTGEQ
jgi:hypothetical protein